MSDQALCGLPCTVCRYSQLLRTAGPDALERHAIPQQLWTDIDSADCDDQLACTEYVNDIVRHLLAAEVRPPDCMHRCMMWTQAYCTQAAFTHCLVLAACWLFS